MKEVNKPKREFSQCIVIVSWTVTIAWITLSFILAFMDKSTNSEVTVALVKESFGVTVAYFLYQGSLKISRNISKVDPNGVPYVIKQKLRGVIFPEYDTPIPEDSAPTIEPNQEDTGL